MDVSEEERLAFAEELEEVALQLAMQDPALDEAQRIQQVSEEYERLSMAAEMFALPEINALLEWAGLSLQTPSAADLLANGKYFSWLEMTALTFREPEEVSHLPLLIGELSDPLWPEALPAERLQSFLLSLRPEQVDAHATEAADAEQDNDDANWRSERNPLQFADDVHPELLAAFMEETPLHISETARLIRLIALEANDDQQRKQAARLAHTVKGSSSVVGIEPIAGFTHRLEDLLDFPLQQMPAALSNTLEAAADCLESLFDNLQTDAGLPDEYAPLQAELSDWIATLSAEAAQDDSTDDSATLPELKALTELPDFLRDTAHDNENYANDLSDDAVDSDVAAVASGGIQAHAHSGQAVGLAATKLNETRIQSLLSLTGELITSTSQTAELLQQSRTLSSQIYQQDDQVRLRLDELEGLVDQQRQQLTKRAVTTAITPTAATSGQSSGAALTKIQNAANHANHANARNNSAAEPEIESYSELYSTTSLLTEAAADSREMAQELQANIRKLSDELYQQQRIQRQLSDAVLALRLTPVSHLIARLERIVRETCRKTGKQAGITFSGQDMQVDADILQGLTDPLLHLLRNAVDHGIEAPEQRQAADKPEAGSIRLSFSQAGNQVTLVLEDDGKGLDPQQIKARALERGLLKAGQDISEDALLRLILLPGFSTRDQVSEVSGRGVGMDVVQAAVERLRGTLKLENQPGQGMRVIISLPQTLIATHALIVRAGGHQLAIPADSVEQLLYVATEESRFDEQGWHIETERYQLPVLKLADLLHWPGTPPAQNQSHTLLIVRSELNAYALYVEEVLPSRDIVINSLAPWLNFIHSVQGACILANGAVAPVLDMIRLLHELESGALQPGAAAVAEDSLGVGDVVQSLLVVDDSLSNRKSMRLILEGLGHTVHTAVDGMDALKLMNEVNVDMVLTDLEMPRMNGLEMTQAIRIWPEMKHLPVVMVTSRGTRKHRDLANQAGVDGYLTKPVQSVQLEEEIQRWLGTQMTVRGGSNRHG